MNSRLPPSLLAMALWTGYGMTQVAGFRLAEYRIKAEFLGTIARFVEWPEEGSQGSDTHPFVVGVLGDSPFELHLEEVLRSNRIHNREVRIRYFRGLTGIEQCQILFICGSERERLQGILAVLKEKPVLTVCDFPQGWSQGVMIAFATVDRRVAFDINLAAARASRLSLSSHMLRVARNVKQ